METLIQIGVTVLNVLTIFAAVALPFLLILALLKYLTNP